MIRLRQHPCRALIWLSRFRYRRGYGVQSPFAYGMIREVINGTGDYYAFADLLKERRAEKGQPHTRLKTDKMLFRLTNFVQPLFLVVPEAMPVLSRHYMEAACRHAAVLTYRDEATLRAALASTVGRPVIVVAAPSAHAGAEVAAALPFMAAGSAMVVAGICQSRTMKRLWSDIVADRRTIVTFDLYDAGLIFFDGKYNKQNYKVNF